MPNPRDADSDSARRSAAVCHENARKEQAKREAEVLARFQARQASGKKAAETRANSQSRPREEPTQSALTHVIQSSREYQARVVRERRAAEAENVAQAIWDQEHPKPRDKRSSAEKLAAGLGQSRIF